MRSVTVCKRSSINFFKMLASPSKPSTISESELQAFLEELDIFSKAEPKKKESPSVKPTPPSRSKNNYKPWSFIFFALTGLGLGLFASWQLYASQQAINKLIEESKTTNNYLNTLTLLMTELQARIEANSFSAPPSLPPENPPFSKEEIIEPLEPPSSDFSVA